MLSPTSLLLLAKEFALLPLLLGYTLMKTLVQYIVRGFHPLFPKWTLRFELACAIKRFGSNRYGEALGTQPLAGIFCRATEIIGSVAGWFSCLEHRTKLTPEFVNGLEHLWITSKRNICEETPDASSTALTTKKKRNRFVVVYYHGGGFVLFSPRYYIDFSNTLRTAILNELRTHFRDDEVELDFFLANYRKGPTHPFPAPAEDALLMYEYLVERHKISPRNIILAGDSAGGGLALSTLLHLRDAKKQDMMPLASILMCPAVDLSDDREGFLPPPHCILSRPIKSGLRRAFIKQPEDPSTWLPYSAVHSSHLRNLPPVFLQTATLDYIYSSSLEICEKAKSDGVQNWEVDIHEGVPHIFAVSSPSVLPYAMVAVKSMATFAAKHIHSQVANAAEK